MKSLFESAVEDAAKQGHELENDPPKISPSMNRVTCKKCGCSVLGNSFTAYGSAIETPCKQEV